MITGNTEQPINYDLPGFVVQATLSIACSHEVFLQCWAALLHVLRQVLCESQYKEGAHEDQIPPKKVGLISSVAVVGN